MKRRLPSIYRILLPGLLLLPAFPLYARDFPDPYNAIDPVELLSEESPGAVMDWEYNQHVFRGSKVDSFNLSVLGGAGLFRVGEADFYPDRRVPRFALGMRYGTYLLTGPGGEDVGTPHLTWLMNSYQFQYGVHAAYAVAPGVRLLAEYARKSDHRMAGHDDFTLSQISYDRLSVGVGLPEVRFAERGVISASARIAYADLFDAWDADDPDESRVQWKLRTGLRAVHPLPLPDISDHEPQGFVELHPDIFTQHDAAGIDANLSARLGFRFDDNRTSRVVDLYFDSYFSRDSEQILDEELPVALLGLGFRIGNASRP